MTASTLLCFIGASIALSASPGPDNLFVISQGIARGRKAALVTAWGMCSGVSVHTAAAALGVSAALYSSALAFNILKYAGAAYLLFLAYKSLREQAVRLPNGTIDFQPGWVLFRRGFLMNVVNPKVAIFFLAFLPQFVTRGSESIPGQMAVLGGLFMFQAVAVFSVIAYLSGGIGNAIVKRPGVAKYFTWLSAGVFTALGLRLAWASR